jgi:poly(3-hydroxybutyrate) depolymerase
MKKLFLAILVLISLNVSAQTYNEYQNKSIASGSNGFAEYLPTGYNLGTGYPVIVFMHGLGEQGNGNSQLFNVSKFGPLSYAKFAGWKPNFVMVAPQWLSGIWPDANRVEQVINYVAANYKIDPNRIYLTGLSMGGGATWDYASSSPSRAQRVAAILPTCGAMGVNTTGAKYMADAKLPVFITHNNGDPVVSYSNSTGWLNALNFAGANPAAVLRTFRSTTHNSWDSTYDPNIKVFNGTLNAYEWMLQYSRGSIAPPIIIPPVVDSPKAFMIIPNDERYVSSQKGWAQTSKDIYGSDKTISGTPFQAFYNAERWGVFSYDIPVSSGSYTVKLYFAELFHSSAGRRVFNVDIEGKRVLRNFDIMARVPKFTAFEQSFSVNVADGRLNISFTPTVDNAKITGIEIIPGELRTLRIITERQDSASNKFISRDTTYRR